MAQRAAIYCRISRDPTGERAGVKRQEKECTALAKRKGWTVSEVFVDDDISAWAGKHRPEYARMLEEIRAGHIDGVIVWHLDRLHRSPLELETFFQVADGAKVKDLATVTGDIDLSTHQGRLYARMMGNVARYESDQKAHRIRSKHAELAQQGRVSGGGTRPFGYEKDRVTIRQAEAREIRQAATRILAGDSLRALAREWDQRGIRTPAGKPWRPNTLARMLRGGRLGGMREHNGEIVGKAVWPAILPLPQWRRLHAMLSDPKRRTTTTTARRYLLGGFLVCGRCGKKLRARPRSHGDRAYGCRDGIDGCGGISAVWAEPLEEIVTGWLFRAVDGSALAKAITARHRKDAQREDADDMIAEDEAELITLAQDFAEKRISRAEWLAARDAIQRRLDVAKAKVAHTNGTSSVVDFAGRIGALAKAWPTMTLDRKRAVLAAVLDHITVKAPLPTAPRPATGKPAFDERRLAPVWRF